MIHDWRYVYRQGEYYHLQQSEGTPTGSLVCQYDPVPQGVYVTGLNGTDWVQSSGNTSIL